MLIVDIFPSVLSTEENMKLKLLQLEEKKIEDILLVRADCLFHEFC